MCASETLSYERNNDRLRFSGVFAIVRPPDADGDFSPGNPSALNDGTGAHLAHAEPNLCRDFGLCQPRLALPDGSLRLIDLSRGHGCEFLRRESTDERATRVARGTLLSQPKGTN